MPDDKGVGLAPYHGCGKAPKVDKRRKLVENDVIQIRKSRLPRRTLAEQFGVSVFMIAQIQTGKSWKHVEPRRATVKRRQRLSACRTCHKTFKQVEDGAPRRYCDDCRQERVRGFVARRQSEILEERMRPLIREVVRECLIEAGIGQRPRPKLVRN